VQLHSRPLNLRRFAWQQGGSLFSSVGRRDVRWQRAVNQAAGGSMKISSKNDIRQFDFAQYHLLPLVILLIPFTCSEADTGFSFSSLLAYPAMEAEVALSCNFVLSPQADQHRVIQLLSQGCCQLQAVSFAATGSVDRCALRITDGVTGERSVSRELSLIS